MPYLALAAGLFIVRLGVLGGLGRGGQDPSPDLGLDVYAQVAGAYVRNLLWFPASYAPSTAAVWPRLGALLLVGLGVASLTLPRRQACLALAGLCWVGGLGLFAMAFHVATVGWLAYFALPGIAIFCAAAVEGSLQRLRSARYGLVRLDLHAPARLVAGSALVLSIAVTTLGWLVTSPLIRTYDQWLVAGDIAGRYTEALRTCANSAPDITHLRLEGLPVALDDSRVTTGQLGVTLFEDYTVASVLRLLAGPRELTFTVTSHDAVSGLAPTMRVTCVANSPSQNTATLTATF